MSSISSVPPEAEAIANNHTPPHGFFFYNHYLTPGDIQYFSLREDKLESTPPDLNYLNNDEAKRHMVPLQSCNGLLLCATRESVDSKRYKSVYVCNPTTRQFKTITVPPTPDGWQVMGVNLAFDPSQSPSCFKVLYFLHPEDGFSLPCDVHVYDSKANTWNPSPLSLNENALAINLECPVFCRRALHWYTHGRSTSSYFDVDKESFHQFPMPSPSGNWLHEYFGESRGHLHMITKPNYGCGNNNGAKFHVLELKEDYSGWFLKYDVNLEQVFRSVEFNEMVAGMTGKLMFTSVLSIIRADREEDTQMVLCSRGTFMSYNFLGDGKLKKLMRIVPCRDPGHITWINVVPVAETLSHLI